MRINLTERRITALKPDPTGKRRVELRDAGVPSLIVRVAAKRKVYALHARFPGTKHPTRRVIGEVGALTRDAARDVARDWLAQIGKGIDSAAEEERPVTLPPGRARLATKPEPTGSFATANTMGMTAVACFTGKTAAPDVRITSTLSRTNSAAISDMRSLLASAQRYSIVTVRPSIQPSSCNRFTNAAVQEPQAEDVAAPRNPITGIAACTVASTERTN
jgi:hypothetical protein